MATEELKVELPPIVMITEARFIETLLEPAFVELYGALAVDVLTLDKAQTKALIDKTIARDPTEEIKDEDLTPLYAAMKPLEEGKEAITFADAKECVLR